MLASLYREVIDHLVNGRLDEAKASFTDVLGKKMAMIISERTMTATHPFVSNFEFDEFGLPHTEANAMGSFIATALAHNIDDADVKVRIVGRYTAKDDGEGKYDVQVRIASVEPESKDGNKVREAINGLKGKIQTHLKTQVTMEYIRQRGKTKAKKHEAE